MRLVVISGLSGSGKSIVLQALEDLGYYCVDNLPIGLLTLFVEQMQAESRAAAYQEAAVVIDARNIPDDLEHFEDVVKSMSTSGMTIEVVFLEAEESTLLRRFSETRRKHPLTSSRRPLREAIQAERKVLGAISSCADLRLDTTNTNVHQLRDLVRERIARNRLPSISLLFLSFGYKYGLPQDADMVFDARCLPNPYWEKRLRAYTGLDDEIRQFLQSEPLVNEMFEGIQRFVETWIPYFERENRSYMTIAVGCTGGYHRSVYLVELLGEYFRRSRPNVLTRHRELL